MADFISAYQFTKRKEGGYANNKNDRGGETWKGISRNNFPLWAGWIIVDSYKKFLTGNQFEASLAADQELQKLVLTFYKDEFFDKLSLDKIVDQAIVSSIFDTAVNMGSGVAILFLQRVLNVSNRNGKDYPDLKADGQIGSKTISTLNQHKNLKLVLKMYNILRGAKYISIEEANLSQEEFNDGWMSRLIF